MLNAKKPIKSIITCYDLLSVCVCVCVREREEGGGEGRERETVNENWCEDTGRMYMVKSRNHKYMNPVGTT